MHRPKGETKPKRKSKRKSESVPRFRPVSDLLNDTDVVNLLGGRKRMSKKRQIVWQYTMKALKGDLAALDMLLKLAKEGPEDPGAPEIIISHVPYRERRSADDK